MTCIFYLLVVLAVAIPGIFMWTFWRDAKGRGWNWTTEASRTMYVDVAKTLITASGIAVALVASSSAPPRAVDAIVRTSAPRGSNSAGVVYLQFSYDHLGVDART